MKTTIARAILAASVTFIGIVTVNDEAKADSANANSAPPTFADLAVGRMTTPPAKRVDYVSARESVPGLYVVAPPSNQMVPANQRQVMIVADERLASQLKSVGGVSREENPSACIGESERNFPTLNGEPHGQEWLENMSTMAAAYPKSPDNPMSGVTAVHSERVVENGATATLESVDAWVDPVTHGAKLIAKSSLPLKLVRDPGFGLKVYAGRDERPDGRRFVQFIVVRPKTTSGEEMMRTNQMWTLHQNGSITHSSSCRHMRVGLPLDKDKDKDKVGDMATIVATVLLPSEGGGEESAPAAPAVVAPAPPAPPPTPAPAITAKNAKKPKAVSSSSSSSSSSFFPSPSGEALPRKEHDLRSRMVNVQVSVSQISRDKDPLVSVSSTWAGREQVDHVADRAD